MARQLSNYEIVTLAVYLLRADSQPLDTEDIAVKANEIAPGRFAWRKYRDQINIELVRTALSDAKKPKNGAFLVGTGKEGWALTERGAEFCKRRQRDLPGVASYTKRLTEQERRWHRSEHIRLLTSGAFQKFASGEIDTITQREAESFFRLDEYIIGEARERKIDRILEMFGNDPELGVAVQTLALRLKGD